MDKKEEKKGITKVKKKNLFMVNGLSIKLEELDPESLKDIKNEIACENRPRILREIFDCDGHPIFGYCCGAPSSRFGQCDALKNIGTETARDVTLTVVLYNSDMKELARKTATHLIYISPRKHLNPKHQKTRTLEPGEKGNWTVLWRRSEKFFKDVDQDKTEFIVEWI